MNSFKIFVWIILIINYRTSSTSADVEEELEEKYGKILYILTTFRHGDRAPVAAYPNDPHSSHMWVDGPNQLLPSGKQRAYEMGRLFLNRYKALLGPKPTHLKIRFESSDIDRAIVSGLSFVAGFYPSNQSFGEDLIWDPIPIHVLSLKEDMYIVNSKPCPRLSKLQQDYWKYDPQPRTWFNKNRKVFEYIQQKAGYEPLDEDDLADVYLTYSQFLDTIRTQEQNNLKLPEWTKSVYPKPLVDIIDPLFSKDIEYDPEMKRLLVGPLLKLVTEEMEAKIKNELPHNIHLLSGHDGTISYAMRALDIYSKYSPPNPAYSSALTFELRQKDDKHYVTITFQNDTMGDPYVIKLPQCEADGCEFSQFKEILQPIIPEDREAECQLSPDEEEQINEEESQSVVDFNGVRSKHRSRAKKYRALQALKHTALLTGPRFPIFYSYYDNILATPFIPLRYHSIPLPFYDRYNVGAI